MTDKAFLEKCVNIDPLKLQAEFTEIAAELSYWNQQYADSMRAYLHSKIARERTQAALYFEKRETLQDTVKRVTEGMTDNAIEIDPRYELARDAEADAQADTIRLKGIAEAVRTKRDMLVSLGAHVRAEMAGDPGIREQHRNAHQTEEMDNLDY